jgi:hypothetical protein
MTEPIRFSDSITIRCQPEITGLVDRAARAKGSKPAEYVRQALLAGLRADGFDAAHSVNRQMPLGDSEAGSGAVSAADEGVQRAATETNPATPLSQQMASEI